MTDSSPKQKLAIAIIHGMGDQSDPAKNTNSSMNILADKIRQEFTKQAKQQNLPTDAEQALAIEPIFWADILHAPEKKLWDNLQKSGSLGHWLTRKHLRSFMIDNLGDPIAYRREMKHMPANIKDSSYYVKVHVRFAERLNSLAETTNGAGPEAPLFIIGHSLGSVIASNYVYDLQNTYYAHKRYSKGAEVPPDVQDVIVNTSLTHGKTLTGFFSMGSPLALWSLMFPPVDTETNRGSPHRPSQPIKLEGYTEDDHNINGQWVNFYAPNDIIGYPLHHIPNYEFVEDIVIRSKRWIFGATPLVHSIYWQHSKVVTRIAKTLVDSWQQINAS